MDMDMSELIVKDNALIEASYTLGLAEQRLILLAIIEARETGEGIDHNSLLRVHAHAYAEQFGIDKNNAYEVIKNASKGLFDRYVTYHDKNPKNGNDRSFHCRWVDKIGYEKATGMVFLRFTSDVVPLITRLESNFTSYEIEQVANLDSGYAIRLYELLVQWRTAGKTPVFELQDFRHKLGVEDSQYKTMSNFKRYVLNFAIDQINEYTDITVKYEQHKRGRTISGFHFVFKPKKTREKTIDLSRDPNTPDLFTGLTDKEKKYQSWRTKGLSDAQISKLAIYTKEFVDANSSKVSPKERRGYPAVFNDWKPLLKDPKTVGTFSLIQELLERTA